VILVVRRLVLASLLAIGSAALIAAMPASAQAFPGNGGSEVSTGTAPAGGALVTHTDPIPANATVGSFSVQPLSGDDLAAFNQLTAAVVDAFPWTAKASKHNQAVLGCVLLSYLPLSNAPPEHVYTYDDVHLQVMLLNMCLQMALAIPTTAAGDAQASAAPRCARINVGVMIKVTHSSAGYKGVSTGTFINIRRPGLNVSCHRSGNGLLIGVKPQKRRQTLRQAGGPTLAIADDNRSTKSLGIRTTFTAN
jgi:hypothetical protein